MSVDVRVILLVEGDTMGEYLHPRIELETLRVYTCTYTVDNSMKKWTLTSLKIDEPFSLRFHFERFLGTDVGWCEGRTLG
jgi:hypothetical protein